ncbi:MAG: J domain-containing protein, partial [Lachnospiraceae bacterium]|nr:J domain-containing protein [Lachnospiraceae bacterium]
ISVTIPAGIDSGQSIRISGMGEPGVNGGSRGDLLVEVMVARHPIFARDGLNLYSTASITFTEAALGGDVKIKTIDGDVLFPIKAGTQTDTRIRLKGKGVPSLRDKTKRGDQYTTLVVKVPEKMNARQKEALKAFDAVMYPKK